MSFGQRTIVLDHQGTLGSSYSENTRWIHKSVVFVGLNVPGSNNNNKVNDATCLSSKSKRTQADCDADNLEFADRNAHNLACLAQSFELAKASGAIGLMVVIQGDPWFDLPETETVNERSDAAFDGYNDLLQALVDASNAFTGQVVLVHGDTHFVKCIVASVRSLL